MNPWDILEIEPSDDLSAIKKAYSRKLKIHHPEEDPDGYQRLREAYDWILKERKKSKKNNSPHVLNVEHIEVPPVTETKMAMTSLLDLPPHIEPIHRKEEMITGFIQKAESLYRDFHSRISREKWLELLNDDAMWNMDMKQQVSRRLLEFVQKHHYLPKPIWQLLENTFQWKELIGEEGELLEDKAAFLKYYEMQIGNYPALSYSSLENVGDLDFDAFLCAREAALHAFMSDHLEEAEERINEAYAIFQEDRDLLLMQGHLLYRLGRLKEAAEAVARILNFCPHDIEAKWLLARLFYEQDAFNEAKAKCEEILAISPTHSDTLSLYGKMLYKEGKFAQAREQFKILQENDPYDVDTISHLAEIHALLDEQASLRKNARLTKKELKDELKTPRLSERVMLFIWSLLSWKVVIWGVLVMIGWNVVSDDLYTNPFLVLLIVIASFFLESISFKELFEPDPFLWLAIFFIGIFILAKEVKAAYNIARF